MGSFSKFRNDARSFIGRSWGKAKQALTGAKGAIDAGGNIYQMMKPIVDEGIEAFGNTRVKDFNRKAQEGIEGGIVKGARFAKELTSHVDKIEDLSNRAFTTFA